MHMHIARTYCCKPYVECRGMSNPELMRSVHAGVHVPTAVADKALIHMTSAFRRWPCLTATNKNLRYSHQGGFGHLPSYKACTLKSTYAKTKISTYCVTCLVCQPRSSQLPASIKSAENPWASAGKSRHPVTVGTASCFTGPFI